MAQHQISAATLSFIRGPHPLFIGGQWRIGEGRAIPVENPATTEILTELPSATPAQLDAAVDAARSAFETGWGRMNARARAAVLMRFADRIEAEADTIGEIMTLEMGQSIKSSRNVARLLAAQLFRYYAGWCDKIAGEAFSPIVGAQADVDFLAATLAEPIGVVGAIIPWNAPPGMIALKLAPALAAGCAVVMKTAELAPLTGSYFARLWREIDGPPGAFNLVHGYGEDIGAAMSAHPGIDKIAFTGSTAVGKQIATAAANSNLKRVTLELGGKSPFIVFPDVDLDAVAKQATLSCFIASGQACVAATRVFVHEEIHDAFTARLKAHTEALGLGDGLDETFDLGPLISARQKARVEDYIRSGEADGALRLTADTPPPAPGHFVRPVVFTGVGPHMRIFREEIFGPVMSVIRFADEDDLMTLVNDTPYGLSGSVWTQNLQRALRIVRRLDAGQIGVNVHAAMSVQTPFGGNKQSGWGREFGRLGLEPYLKTKAVTLKIG